jgi:1,2-phenylacetyl-CoA epoxidase catalytic subunit
MPESNYTDSQRARIIKECAQWYCELKTTDNKEVSKENLRQFIRECKEESDDELRQTWHTTVGEWLASLSNISIPDSVDRETWVDNQFESILKDDTRNDYSFLFEVPIRTVKEVNQENADIEQ